MKEVFLQRSGIFYTEIGDNSLYVHIVSYVVEETGKAMIGLIASIDQSELTSQFTAMAMGKILYSIPMADFMENAKAIEDNFGKETE